MAFGAAAAFFALSVGLWGFFIWQHAPLDFELSALLFIPPAPFLLVGIVLRYRWQRKREAHDRHVELRDRQLADFDFET
jgi:membrane protein implicated in regulation of membrane protease activity